mgnify:CR=1 FL=1
MSGFVAVAVADNDQVNVNDIRRLGAFVASAFGRNQPGIATTGSPEEREFRQSVTV